MPHSLRDTLACCAILVAAASLAQPLLARAEANRPDQPAQENIRGLGQAILNYVVDADGLYPLAHAPRNPYGFAWNVVVHVPAGWREDAAPGSGRAERDAVAFPNSVMPYLPELAMLAAPNVPDVRQWPEGPSPKQPLRVGYSLNGLLHTYPQASLFAPGVVPLLWQGHGRVNMVGASVANPALRCDFFQVCRYGEGDIRESAHFLLKEAMPIQPPAPFQVLSVDLSLRSVPLAEIMFPLGKNEPPTAIMLGQAMQMCVNAGGEGRYPCFFRPDQLPPGSEAENLVLRHE
jgi:hypothetical protein